MRNHPPILLPLLALTTLLATNSPAEIPNQSNPDGYTDAKYRDELLRLNLKTTVEAYATAGKRNPAWDNKAVAFLEAMAKHFTYAPCPYFVDYPQHPAPPELLALGKAALDAGCGDPLVLHFYTLVLKLNFSKQPPEPYLARMAPMMLESKYPPLRVSAAVGDAVRLLRSPEHAQLRDRCQKAIPDIFKAALAKNAIDDLGPIGPRYAIEFLETPWHILPELEGYEKLVEFTKIGRENGLHPYVMHCLAGKARYGMMFGSPYTDATRAKYARNLEDARTELTQALKEYPQFPTAPAIFISVLGAQEQQDLAEMRRWFERATEIQFDYDLAYLNYRRSLRTRTADALTKEVLEFAEECAKTQRYDTFVPFLYIKFHDELTYGDPSDAPQPDEATGAAVMKGYLNTYRQPHRRAAIHSHLAASAAFDKNYADVCTHAEQAGPALSARHFERLGLIGFREIQHAHAATSPSAEAIAKADALDTTIENAQQALDTFTTLLKSLAPTDKARPYVNSRIAQLQAELKFLAGESVDIQPAPDLAGWSSQSGKWSVDKDGALLGECTTEPLEIYHLARFGKRYTLSGHIEVVCPSQGVKDPARAGPFLMGAPGSARCTLTLAKDPKGIALGEFYWPTKKPKTRSLFPAEVTGNDDFSVDVFDNRAVPTVNGKLITRRFTISDETADGPAFIGLGTNEFNNGAVFRFTKLKIKRLDNPPPAPAETKKP
jgi:hypothetical protein